MSLPSPPTRQHRVTTLVDDLLAEQQSLTAVERFSRHHDQVGAVAKEKVYRSLLPARAPKAGEQYAFEVDLDACSGCKACVAGCHSLNGLDEHETWREVGLLVGEPSNRHGAGPAIQQTITSACHHCVDPGCLGGCPVKAYDKDAVTGIVRHLDDQCIGCQYCVMKCPYEVPKFSAKLGIVRKCDMCVNRLAVGEAPACVQSCPNGAIKITLVNQAEIKSQTAAKGVDSFLADTPDPRITVPTTRYLTKWELQNLFAADQAVPRLDQPHWPLVVMLVFTQAAVGLFALALPSLLAGAAGTKWLLLMAFALLNLGLLVAPLHLGRPLKAWRAFLGWRTSWLSREIIAFNQLAPLGAAAVMLAWLPWLAQTFPPVANFMAKLPGWVPPLAKMQWPLLAGVVLVGLACVFVSAMVYVDTKRACWAPRHTLGAFYLTAGQLGLAFAAAGLALTDDTLLARELAGGALLLKLAAYGWRHWENATAARNAQHPCHLNARAYRELLPELHAFARVGLVGSLVFGLLALGNVAGGIKLWTAAAALLAVASEVAARYVFFRAGAGKKMPGGVAA